MKSILFFVLFSSFNTFGYGEFQCTDLFRLEKRIEKLKGRMRRLTSECGRNKDAVSECSKTYTRDFCIDNLSCN